MKSKNDTGFDKQYYEMVKEDFHLLKHSSNIDALWKYVLLNKMTLVTIIDDDEADAFADIYTELAHTKKNAFTCFKKRKG